MQEKKLMISSFFGVEDGRVTSSNILKFVTPSPKASTTIALSSPLFLFFSYISLPNGDIKRSIKYDISCSSLNLLSV